MWGLSDSELFIHTTGANNPRNSNRTLWLYRQNCNISRLSRYSQKRRQPKENETKYRNMTKKALELCRILIYRLWVTGLIQKYHKIYYLFKISCPFSLVSIHRLILHNQRALTIFGRCEKYTIDSRLHG